MKHPSFDESSLPPVAERAQLAGYALQVARQASELTMQGFRGKVRISSKAHDELFTEYDVKSEECVRQALAELTPSIAVVGEEHGGTPAEGLTWYIDPIDGTINFICGSPWFAVSVGLMLGSQPVAGAVVAPALGLAWHGWVGGSAFRNGKECRVSTNDRLADAVVTTGYPARPAGPVTKTRAESFLGLVERTRDVRRGGSAAIELSMVADGSFDAYWCRHLNYWDTGAGAAMVLGAGGTWRTLVGENEGPRDAQDVAANGLIDGQLDQLIT